jgi:hypothetical protein
VGDLCIGRSQIGSTSVLSDRDLEYLEVEERLVWKRKTEKCER